MARPISVVVERGAAVESTHLVHVVGVRGHQVVEAAGDPDLITFMRSAAKPLQALPLALELPELPERELAIACASHEAGEEQLECVRALLRRSESSEDELECGYERGSKLRHNCSGKHAAMLLRAKRRSMALPGYRLAGHPLQRELHGVVADAVGQPTDAISTATDGCGVVTFAASLAAMARAFARLAAGELPGSSRVAGAMRARPDLVGGPTSVDTALMQSLPGAIAKRGAEGLLCAGLAGGTGIAVKVADGGNRAAGPALAHVLGLEALSETSVFNSRGEAVGRVFARS